MDAIKKKMQAMKVEKDNAMDRSDVCEQQAKEAKIRAAKAEEEVADLVKKAQQLEVELDKTKEELLTTTQKLEEKEKALLASELEVWHNTDSHLLTSYHEKSCLYVWLLVCPPSPFYNYLSVHYMYRDIFNSTVM